MIDFSYRPTTYFSGENTSVLLVRMHFPESTWGEQISLYAHFLERKIQFEAVDFYGNDYMIYPGSCEDPLTLEELIYLIEGIQLNQDTAQGAMELVRDAIPEVERTLYPELKFYFEEKRKSFGLS